MDNFVSHKNATSIMNGIATKLQGSKPVIGNPITIIDAEPINAESVIVELEPKQDLHGYDAPWVGGVGKNLLPIPDLPTTINNIRFSRNDDGSIKIERLSSSSNWATLILATNLALSSQGIATCEGGNNSTCFLEINDVRVYQDVSVSLTDTVSTAQISVAPQFSGTTILKPMIRLATETDPTFEPYSNICPITGYSEVNVKRVGKNLLRDFSSVVKNGITLTYDDGVVILNGTARANTFFILSNLNLPNNNYTFSANNDTVNSSVHVFLRKIDASSNFTDLPMNKLNKYNTYQNVSIGQVILYVISGTQLTNFRLPLQIEVGDSKTTFEPYQGDTYTLQFGDTVYGAEVDFVSGVATVKYRYVDLGDLEWIQNGPYFWCYVDGKKYGRINMLSECYKVVGRPYYELEFGEVCGDDVSNAISVYDNRYSSVNDFTNAVTGIKLCYELATPYTIQLTPTQIQMLENTNNISTDGTNIQLKYQSNNVIGECKAYTNKLMNAKLQGSKQASSTGGTIEIPDYGMTENIKMYFNPTQDLHGYDKPWAGGAGKNKLKLEFESDTPTMAGMTFAHTESEYSINGTATISYQILAITNVPTMELGSNYTLSVDVEGSLGSSQISIVFRNSGQEVKRVSLHENRKIVTFQLESAYNEVRFILEGFDVGSSYTYSAKIMLEQGNQATTFEPYSNICPISGQDNATFSWIDDEDIETVCEMNFGDTYYGGFCNFNGQIFSEWDYIASYNGETLSDEWVSDRDEYVTGTTPTIGAEVAYKTTPSYVRVTPPANLNLTDDYPIEYNGYMASIDYQPKNTVLAEAKKYTNQEIAKLGLPKAPTTDGIYHLECSISEGVPTITWSLNE